MSIYGILSNLALDSSLHLGAYIKFHMRINDASILHYASAPLVLTWFDFNPSMDK